MKTSHRFFTAISLFLCLLLPAYSAQGTTVHHRGSRAGLVKIEHISTQPNNATARLHGENLARAFLQENATRYGLTRHSGDLVLGEVKESLLGSHYHFHQNIDRTPVHRGEVIVSISNRTGQIYKVFNNFYPASTSHKRVSIPEIDEDGAYDIAWKHLRVHGELTAEPGLELVYLPEDGRMRLAYIADLSVAAPFGHWRHMIDAVTGEIIRVMRRSISNHPMEQLDFSAYTGRILDRKTAFTRFAAERRAKQGAALSPHAKKADGTGIVFETDPRTALMNASLQDNSPASAFEAAYTQRPLPGITVSNGVYSLTGPHVNIVNFEAPNTRPSTTNDGNWTAKRGNNAFNDAMVYFQIDQNQRYLQSLGFTGSRGIQQGGISVDTDGVNGEDNSYYIPGSNQIAFGHGCVDDSEESFTILHEYGHAIHIGVSPNWDGGDTGAMGEGFGDYWAASHRYGSTNGSTFNPAWAFPWVGHNSCWQGRRLDTNGAQYDPNQTYPAHGFVDGFEADELWSTPLFQAMIALTNQGVSKSEVDTIVIESLFGAGFGMSMRDMAGQVVNTAQQLYPDGPHADVFTERFQAQNILAGGSTGGGDGGGDDPDDGGPGDTPVGGELVNGIPVTGLSGAADGMQRFTFQVPADASSVQFTINGGGGDADLYVRFGQQPTLQDFDESPYLAGNNESVTIANPQSGTWHVMIHGYEAYNGLTLKAQHNGDSGTDPGDGGGDPGDDEETPPTNGGLVSGIPVTGLSGTADSQQAFTIQVPNGASRFEVRISGGSGDADLYVRRGQPATLQNYDESPFLAGNNETVNITNPQGGTWHIMIYGYEAYNNLTLTATIHGGTDSEPGDDNGGDPGDGGGTGTQTFTFSGSLQPNAWEIHTVQANGGNIRVELNWNNNADLDLALYAPTGQDLAVSWFDQPEIIDIPLDGSGTYEIEVHNFEGNAANYTVTVILTNQ